MSLFSFVQPSLAALGLAPDELQVADAEALTKRCYPSLSTDRPALIGLLKDTVLCGKLCELLRQAYPDAHRVFLVGGGGGRPPETSSLPLNRLVECIPSVGSWLLYVPPLPCPGAIETFQHTVARLRAPDGCPWDRKQTHRSLRQGFQEEAYEVLDALDRDDVELLKEELGDILLHILLQAQIASERGEFRMSDVVCHANAKIVHRHPHVFGDWVVSGVEEVLVNWEELKHQEKQAVAESPSALDGIPGAMPALARAQSIQRHVARLGLLPEGVDDLLARVCGALSSLSTAPDCAAQEVLLGDLLFDLANLALKLGIDAESALRNANLESERHFRESE